MPRLYLIGYDCATVPIYRPPVLLALTFFVLRRARNTVTTLAVKARKASIPIAWIQRIRLDGNVISRFHLLHRRFVRRIDSNELSYMKRSTIQKRRSSSGGLVSLSSRSYQKIQGVVWCGKEILQSNNMQSFDDNRQNKCKHESCFRSFYLYWLVVMMFDTCLWTNDYPRPLLAVMFDSRRVDGSIENETYQEFEIHLLKCGVQS